MEKVINVPSKVENNIIGFRFLTNLFNETEELENTRIILEFKNTRWFEANLVAVLGAWIEIQRRKKNSVALSRVSKSIRRVFMKNGFYEHYKLGSEFDVFDSTIAYKIFDSNEQDIFIKYVKENVMPKIRLQVDTKVAKGFITSLGEIFINVKFHADSKEVITCGQYYHTHKKVCFTIVDIGKTIGDNVKRKLGNPYLDDSEAIDWATQYGNTTKENDEFGGIGLHIISEFLEKNGGIFQIISGNGYWEKAGSYIFKEELNSYFPGTIVNIQSSLEHTLEDKSPLIF